MLRCDPQLLLAGLLAVCGAEIFVKNASLLVEVIVKAEDLTKVSESLCNKAYVWYLSMEKAEEGEDEEKTKWRKSTATPALGKPSTHNDKALGSVVCVNAKATFASSRSLEVVVTVTAETFGQDTPKICVQGVYTFVSLGKDGRVQALPAISPETTQEKKAYQEGQKRYLKRRELRIKQRKRKS
eukprot:jgi/Bigna1/70909/fgenesh1_pg.13_\